MKAHLESYRNIKLIFVSASHSLIRSPNEFKAFFLLNSGVFALFQRKIGDEEPEGDSKTVRHRGKGSSKDGEFFYFLTTYK